jgi:hypothetical protein
MAKESPKHVRKISLWVNLDTDKVEQVEMETVKEEEQSRLRRFIDEHIPGVDWST